MARVTKSEEKERLLAVYITITIYMKYLPVSGRTCHQLGGAQAHFQLFAEQRLVIKLISLFHYKFAGDCHDKV